MSLFFTPKSIGKSLKEVAIDVIDTPHDSLVSRWFHNETGVDLFTWSDSKQTIIKQQLSFHGQVVEWNCLEGLKTGVVIETDMGDEKENEKENQDAAKLSETVKFDEKPQGKSILLALDILNHLNVDGDFRNQLITNFKSPENIKTLSSRDFITRFGMAIKNYQKSDPGFWDNLKKRFQDLFKQKPTA